MNTGAVGNTPMIELANIKSDYGIKNVYLKDEGRNPYGTVRDRRNHHIVERAKQLKVDKLVVMTSGTNGYSLSKFAAGSPLKIVSVINKNAPEYTKKALRSVCYHVIELNLDYRTIRPEELISFAREKDDEVIWEVTNGFEEYYEPIIPEILHKTKPDYIVVSVGSGNVFIGIAEAIQKYKCGSKLIGIGVQNTSYSIADRLSTAWTPYTKALQAYAEQGHSLYYLCEEEIKKTHAMFKNMVRSEPSSSVVFAALQKHSFKPKDTIVFINSGKCSI
jgi:cysteine synthase